MIDFHAHNALRANASWLGGADFGTAEFLDFLAAGGFDAALVLSHDGLFSPGPEANDALAAFVAPAADRLFALGTVNPRDGGAVAETERMMTTLRMAGMKLHPWLQGISLHERVLDPVCEVLVAHDGLLLCHDGTPPYSTALQIGALARRHPRLPVVLGHGGLHDTWREALTATQEIDNLYLCLCGTPPYAAARIVAAAPPHKVLFGTDAGLSRRVGQHYAVARVREMERWPITPEQRHRITEENPRALLAGRLA